MTKLNTMFRVIGVHVNEYVDGSPDTVQYHGSAGYRPDGKLHPVIQFGVKLTDATVLDGQRNAAFSGFIWADLPEWMAIPTAYNWALANPKFARYHDIMRANPPGNPKLNSATAQLTRERDINARKNADIADRARAHFPDVTDTEITRLQFGDIGLVAELMARRDAAKSVAPPVSETVAETETVADVSVADVPVADVPVADVSVADVPVADVPVADVPVADVPVADVSVADVSVADVSVADVPVAETVADPYAGMTKAERKAARRAAERATV